MTKRQTPRPMVAGIRALRDLVQRPDFVEFRAQFDDAISRAMPTDIVTLQRVAAEAFELFLESSLVPEPQLLSWFADHHERGNIEVTQRLVGLIRRLERTTAQSDERYRHAGVDPGPVVIQMKRVVQMSWFGTAGFEATDIFELRRSVFRSPQERAFYQALWQRFPGLRPLPNYPLDQITDIDRLRGRVSSEAWRYGQFCRLDAVLVTPVEGDPVAAFELDSGLHDDPDYRRRDQLKNELLHAARVPLFRLRSDAPTATSIAEWFSILTDQVLDKINVGERLRTRELHTTLVPLYR